MSSGPRRAIESFWWMIGNAKRFSTRGSKSYEDVIHTNILINRHLKCGQLELARKLFEEMPRRTVVTWNTLISGYSTWGRHGESLHLTSLMHRNNVRFREATFSAVLSACAHSGSFHEGREVHCLVLKSGSVRFELVGSALLYFYACCDEIDDAARVFEELREGNGLLWPLMLVGLVRCDRMDEALEFFWKMPSRDVVGWTTLISGYSKNEDGCKKALDVFKQMMGSGEVVPNEFTLDCVLRVCGRLGDRRAGEGVHGLVIKHGYDTDHSVSGSLVAFYCGCEDVDEAKKVYEMTGELTVNASNSLIQLLMRMGRVDDANKMFSEMIEVSPAVCNLMIKEYAMSDHLEDSERLFEIMQGRNLVSYNTMISVYSKNGEIDKALQLFEEVKGQGSSVTWNSAISGCIRCSRHAEAFSLYKQMRKESIPRTRSTFSALLHGCSCIGSLQLGQALHSQVLKTPFHANVYVGTSLIDMYSRCGSMNDAQASFWSISSPNVAAWTALLNGCAHHGLGLEAVQLFGHMLEQGVNPNEATFVGILSACSYSGLVDAGMRFFHVIREYGVEPKLEHYACMVDLLGRAGHLKEAEEFIEDMPLQPDSVIWGALLSACWRHGDSEMGERVAKKIMSMDSSSVPAYVILSNIYSSSGRWAEKKKVRKKLRSLGTKKDPGLSWIELNNVTHAFVARDVGHPQSDNIYSVLGNVTANADFAAQDLGLVSC
ncbi:hypothetical protein MLD38_002922 [Melastoma candidum]|uniref:Uncharacterized protein n=1 Tax=Melastoma candidum TaxID=119954 RepID=A0ACB9S2W0_9MYRT|nr:hypothetical protein MLD38_002922 [Melastoma candidum]